MSELPVLELLRPELAELRAYRPVEGEFRVRLDANEAPPSLSEQARKLLGEAAANTAWERYPDATLSELRSAIAARCGVGADEVVAGVGSDEIISLLVTTLTRVREKSMPPTVLTTTPTFVMYRMSARVRGLAVVEVPLDAQWDLSEQSLLRALDMNTPHIVFIASPNNPTSNLMDRARLERLIEAAPKSLVVIDEAYIDYSSRDQLELYRKYPNVAILRTLSKIGFAALRVGFLLARPELALEIDKARLPYNLPTVSQRLATLALRELAPEIARVCGAVVAERERVARELASMGGLAITPSEANFLWIRTERPAAELFDGLKRAGILVRSFHERGGRLGQQLRVTIGTPEENDAFLNALRTLA